MDKILNPFSPGAGTPPPELTGREEIIEQCQILLGRVKLQKPEKSLLMIGLRGVGKTVLLSKVEDLAHASGYQTIFLEACEEQNLAKLLVPPIKKLLYKLSLKEGVKNKVRQSISVLKSFISSMKLSYRDIQFGVDIEAEPGTADYGDIELDMPELFIALGEAAKEQNTPIGLLIDEVQYLSKQELSALIMSAHKIQQKQLPIVIVGAGLPTLPGLAGEAKSYAERLFNYPELGPLDYAAAKQALKKPTQESGADIDEKALKAIFKQTQGYPYFLQEWGYQAWNEAPSSPINEDDVTKASLNVTSRLDTNFFRVRFDRLTPKEKEFLKAMATLPPKDVYKSRDVALLQEVSVQKLSPVRNSLIKKGMIYSPAHGYLAFTVPLFDQFIKRTMG